MGLPLIHPNSISVTACPSESEAAPSGSFQRCRTGLLCCAFVLGLASAPSYSQTAITGKCAATANAGTEAQLDEARCLDANGQIDQALSQVHRYREVHPTSVDGALAEAQVLMETNQFLDAAEIVARVLQVHPHSVPALELSADLSSRLNDLQAAERLLVQCTKEAPGDAQAWERLGDFYLATRPKDAAVAFSKALSINADEPLALAARGVAEARLEQTKNATEDFERALSLARNSPHPLPVVKYLYAEFLRTAGHVRESLPLYDGAISDDPSFADAYLGRANAAMSLEKWEAARKDLDKISSDPRFTMASLSLLVKVYRRLGNQDRAAALSLQLEQMSSENDKSQASGNQIAAQLKAAADLMNQNKCGDVISIDEKLLADHPNVGEAYLQMARCDARMQRLDAAEAALHSYIATDKNSLAGLVLLGKVLLKKGQVVAAREQFTAAQAIDPLLMDAQLGLAACFIQEQKFADAERVLKGALQIPHTAPDVHLMLAECLYKEQRSREALEQVSRAFILDPENASAKAMKAAITGNTTQ
jgi:tetratricopeptide (TPR) repeat protein